jgi:hypothetical protein
MKKIEVFLLNLGRLVGRLSTPANKLMVLFIFLQLFVFGVARQMPNIVAVAFVMQFPICLYVILNPKGN